MRQSFRRKHPLHSVRCCGIDSQNDEKQSECDDMRGKREAEVRHGSKNKSHGDHWPLADLVRKAAQWIGGKNESQAVDEIHKRHIPDRTHFFCFQKHERNRKRPQPENKNRAHDKNKFFICPENTPVELHFSLWDGGMAFLLFYKHETYNCEESKEKSNEKKLAIIPA